MLTVGPPNWNIPGGFPFTALPFQTNGFVGCELGGEVIAFAKCSFPFQKTRHLYVWYWGSSRLASSICSETVMLLLLRKCPLLRKCTMLRKCTNNNCVPEPRTVLRVHWKWPVSDSRQGQPLTNCKYKSKLFISTERKTFRKRDKSKRDLTSINFKTGLHDNQTASS